MKRAILAVLLASTALPSQAANIDVNGNVISISGNIHPNDLLLFEVETDGLDKPMVISLDSNGGSFMPAIKIGELTRKNGWSTHVEGRCISACAIIWLAGSKKSMQPTAKIGFHQAYSHETHQVSAPAMNILRSYLAKLGYSKEMIEFAAQAGPTDMKYFTEGDGKRLGVQVIVGAMAEPSMAAKDEASLATLSSPLVRYRVPYQLLNDRVWKPRF